MKRPSATNVLAGVLLLYFGYCAGINAQAIEAVEPEPSTLVFWFEPFIPHPLHLLAYAVAESCVRDAGWPIERTAADVGWGVARTIVASPSGILARGLWAPLPRTIVLDDEEKWDMTVTVHEAIHAASGVKHGDPKAEELFARCSL